MLRRGFLILSVVLLAACTPSNVGPMLARDLAFDGSGRLWAVGDRGAVRWDLERGTHTRYTARDGLPIIRVSAVAIAPDGAVWFGTDSGAARFDGKAWTTYTTGDGLADDVVNAIAVAPDGTVWFGTDGGASRFDGQTWTTYRAGNAIGTIAVAPDGAVWLDAFRFDGETLTHYTTDDGLASSAVTALAVAPDGAVWAGTYGGGVSRFDGQTWTTHRAADAGAGPSWVEALAVAPDGAVWCATRAIDAQIPEHMAGSGVSRFDGQAWTTYATADGLASNFVTAIAVAPDGAVWFGTQVERGGAQGGLSRFDGETWTTYTW